MDDKLVNKINWDEQPFGEIKDIDLARQLCVTPSTVRYQRLKRGITIDKYNLEGKRFGRLVVLKKDESVTKGNPTKWFCQCDCGNTRSILGCSLKNGATRSCGCLHREIVTNRSISKTGIDWDSQPLGEMSDAKLANLLGVSREIVGKNRHKRGISVFVKKQNIDKIKKENVNKITIDWDSQPLGEMSDIKLAKKLGVVTNTVRYHRLKRGISSFKKINK